MKDQPTKSDSETAQAAYEVATQDFEQKREEWRRYLPKVDTLDKAIQAARSEAEAANTQWREKFQDSDGAITPEVKRLRKDWRDAADLVDEYELLHGEMLRGRDIKRLALAEAAGECLKARRLLASAVMEAEIEKLATTCGPAIRQIGALFRARFEDHSLDKFSPGYTDDPEELDRRFFHRLASAIGPCDTQSENLILPPLDLSDVDQKLMRSPSNQAMLRKKLLAPRSAA